MSATIISPLEVARREAGLTQAELGAAAGVRRETIGRLERGDDVPSLPTAVAIAEVLGRGLLELFSSALNDHDAPCQARRSHNLQPTGAAGSATG